MTTQKITSAIKTLVLVTLFVFGMLFLLGEETDATACAFLFHFIIDKALAAAALYGAYRLLQSWKHDPFLSQFCD